jgi:hypothetical protein
MSSVEQHLGAVVRAANEGEAFTMLGVTVTVKLAVRYRRQLHSAGAGGTATGWLTAAYRPQCQQNLLCVNG